MYAEKGVLTQPSTGVRKDFTEPFFATEGNYSHFQFSQSDSQFSGMTNGMITSQAILCVEEMVRCIMTKNKITIHESKNP